VYADLNPFAIKPVPIIIPFSQPKNLISSPIYLKYFYICPSLWIVKPPFSYFPSRCWTGTGGCETITKIN